jgi:hypothetical protein
MNRRKTQQTELVENTKLVVDDIEAERVREIFRL